MQNTVRAQSGTVEITDILRNDTTGSPVYVFYFKNAELFPPLYVASDGSVLRSNLTVAVGATQESLVKPPPVAVALAASGWEICRRTWW